MLENLITDRSVVDRRRVTSTLSAICSCFLLIERYISSCQYCETNEIISFSSAFTCQVSALNQKGLKF